MMSHVIQESHVMIGFLPSGLLCFDDVTKNELEIYVGKVFFCHFFSKSTPLIVQSNIVLCGDTNAI